MCSHGSADEADSLSLLPYLKLWMHMINAAANSIVLVHARTMPVYIIYIYIYFKLEADVSHQHSSSERLLITLKLSAKLAQLCARRLR